jgi:type IV pilus biogenesis protein CpaD/CtpE
MRVRIRLPEGRTPPSEPQLRDAMTALGIPVGIAALSGQPSGSNRTVLVIYHLTAVAPDCDSMITPSEAIQMTPFASEKRPTMSFGCATYSNLAGMVADPADLAGGRTFAGSDGADIDAAVTRFHDDKVKELRSTTSSVSGSNSN